MTTLVPWARNDGLWAAEWGNGWIDGQKPWKGEKRGRVAEGKETENRVPVPLETACPLPKYKLADGPGCVKYLTVKSGRRSTFSFLWAMAILSWVM
jgi:hypothetical protein